MSLKPFTEEQIASLRSNPNVKKATPKSIQFAERFKLEFIERYDDGEAPSRIFQDCGFDVESIGRERVRNAYTNWLHKRSLGKTVTSGKKGRRKTEGLTKDEIIAQQKCQIEMLRQENDFLRQIRRLERRHQPSKSPSKRNTK